MSPWQGGELLQPITEEHPCGENLEYTPLLASFDTFRLFGQSAPLDRRTDDRGNTIPAPDWGEIRGTALDALGKSKDLRLLAHLATALLRTDGLHAFTEALTVAARWLETYWDGLYPVIEDGDAIFRRNALNCFADPMAVVDALRRLPLVRSRQHGAFSLRDLDIAAGTIQPTDGEARPDEAQINAAFAEMPIDDLRQLHQTAVDSVAAVKSVESVMSAQGGTEMVPELQPLSTQLIKVEKALRAQLAARPEAAAGEAAGDGAATESGAVQTKAVGAIRSRQDAIRALDAVSDFFRHNEPSSPVPLFVERAKRLVSKDFLEVLADVAPDALGQARAAGGLPQE